MKKSFIAIILATIWISISEFFRNEFLFKHYWTKHFESMGLDFPDTPINGAMWGVWSLMFAIFLLQLTKKFNFLQSLWMGWLAGFILMWISVGNLGVLPFQLLWFAVPLSILEVGITLLIINKITKTNK